MGRNARDRTTKKYKPVKKRATSTTTPKGLVGALARTVAKQITLGNKAGDILQREAQEAKVVARRNFEGTNTKGKQVRSMTKVVMKSGSLGLTKIKRTVNLSKEPLNLTIKDPIVKKYIRRMEYDDMVSFNSSICRANNLWSPTMTPVITLTKGALGVERIPLFICHLNGRPAVNMKYWQSLNYLYTGFDTDAQALDTPVETPFGVENAYIDSSKMILNSMSVKLLLYGGAKRQARYRVIVFRPKNIESDLLDVTGLSSVGANFTEQFMGSYLDKWVSSNNRNPVSIEHRDPRMHKYFTRNYDIRYDQEIVIDETTTDEDSLKQVLLKLYLPLGSSGMTQDFRYSEDHDLGTGLMDPERIEPQAASYSVGSVTKPGTRWYLAVISNETLNDTDQATYKDLGFDISVKRHYKGYKCDSIQTNSIGIA